MSTWLATPTPPPPPPHHSIRDDNGNEEVVIDDSQMKELQDFLDHEGNLDNLDTMVNEFANEYLNEKEENNGNSVRS